MRKVFDVIRDRISSTGGLASVKQGSNTDTTQYVLLLAGLKESREHLRVLQVSGEQQNVDLAKALYRMDSAIAAISELLATTRALAFASFPTEPATYTDRNPASHHNIRSTA